jgi:flavin reductase (DIM6/NTAB) family NADH-FMN oxidoreductase RutF
MGSDGVPTGMTVGTFTSVSLDPPLVAFLPDKSSTSWPKIEAAGSFCVNVLNTEQKAICSQIAAKTGDKFQGLNYGVAVTGSPVLDGVAAWIDCDIDQVVEAGDHYIVIGRVRALDASESNNPLLFLKGQYGQCGPLNTSVG